MDPAWIGVLGTAIGAAAGGVPSIIKAFLDWRTASADRAHQAAMRIRDDRQHLVKQWHSGLAAAHREYMKWYVELHKDVSPDTAVAAPDRPGTIPDAVGTEWFESLRPFISETGDAGMYRLAEVVYCDKPTAVALSLEIARIEHRWLDAAK